MGDETNGPRLRRVARSLVTTLYRGRSRVAFWPDAIRPLVYVTAQSSRGLLRLISGPSGYVRLKEEKYRWLFRRWNILTAMR